MNLFFSYFLLHKLVLIGPVCPNLECWHSRLLILYCNSDVHLCFCPFIYPKRKLWAYLLSLPSKHPAMCLERLFHYHWFPNIFSILFLYGLYTFKCSISWCKVSKMYLSFYYSGVMWDTPEWSETPLTSIWLSLILCL